MAESPSCKWLVLYVTCMAVDKLQLCIEERRAIVKEEFRQQELDDALNNLHVSSVSDLTSI